MNKIDFIKGFLVALLVIGIASAGLTKQIQDPEGLKTVDSDENPQHFSPAEIQRGIDEKQIKTAYIQSMTDLNLIINTTSPTETQQNWAIKRLAQIERQELLFHKKEIQK